MECFTIEIRKYIYGTDAKIKIIKDNLKSTPIEVSHKIIFENNIKCSMIILSFICEKNTYDKIIYELEN